LHVFTYSERPGTKALEIGHVVSQEEKHRRTRLMLAVSECKLEEFTNKYVGTVRPVLIEHPRHDGSMAGFTDNYLRVNIAPDASLSNEVRPVRIVASNICEEETDGEVVE
ncbi:MAG: tRNA (N(6)-L-threonylcarbamoyladenosine(37)-C(2))-methylthiotransferase MtaB, partial [Muribaculum sp.]|nr:tRNA (N(6)-L-threonylcarbamoyladenosine(37)-C(2))-methylthiotransferase MtaB [Muribaculum sp.]